MNINGQQIDYIDVTKLVNSILGTDQHIKRIQSIANAALGIISSASLIVHRIGRGLARSLNLIDKHAIKQVDRLLSNPNFDLEETQKNLISYIIGTRKEVKITMDWTDFDKDDHSTLSLNLVTTHGRATPLLSKTFKKSSLKNNRNNYEDDVLRLLRKFIPEDVQVTILADRGFCDTKLFAFLQEELGFEYIIRIRSNILVETKTGEYLAGDLVRSVGLTRTLRNVTITSTKYPVGTFICIKAAQMKQAWCIVSSSDKITGSSIVQWYSKRWGCESQFRDTKDLYFGMGLSKTSIKDAIRRDRLLLIHAIATILLTCLGAAGEQIGLDKYLKANTVKKRTMSLFNQGCIYFARLPKMVHATLIKLLSAFYKIIDENKNLQTIVGVI